MLIWYKNSSFWCYEQWLCDATNLVFYVGYTKEGHKAGTRPRQSVGEKMVKNKLGFLTTLANALHFRNAVFLVVFVF